MLLLLLPLLTYFKVCFCFIRCCVIHMLLLAGHLIRWPASRRVQWQLIGRRATEKDVNAFRKLTCCCQYTINMKPLCTDIAPGMPTRSGAQAL